jgi:hypothetical protein
MNIFYLSKDPVKCAEWMVDKHVVKMILETAQLLSTAHRVLDGEMTIKTVNGRKKKVYVLDDEINDVLYSATHINHPSAIWARQTEGNYQWLHRHLMALLNEYTFRYGKLHAVETKGIARQLWYPPMNIKQSNRTPMPSCMDEEYRISEDPIVNYRNYYRIGKAHLHNWKKRQPPDWIAA